MVLDLNLIVLCGRLASDAELRVFDSGSRLIDEFIPNVSEVSAGIMAGVQDAATSAFCASHADAYEAGDLIGMDRAERSCSKSSSGSNGEGRSIRRRLYPPDAAAFSPALPPSFACDLQLWRA